MIANYWANNFSVKLNDFWEELRSPSIKTDKNAG